MGISYHRGCVCGGGGGCLLLTAGGTPYHGPGHGKGLVHLEFFEGLKVNRIEIAIRNFKVMGAIA